MSDIDDEDRFNQHMLKLANKFIDAFAEVRILAPAPIAITTMTGALASLAIANGFKRNNVIDAINSAFDDLEDQP